MKISKFILFLAPILITFFSCDNEPVDFTFEENFTSENNDIKWWILVHPSYGNSGIYLYNETNSTIENILPLPDSNGSPHALDFDGNSLWLGGAKSIDTTNGIVTHNPIYELNPDNGEVISTIDNIRTEGIAVSDNHIYYSTYGQIIEITKTGIFVSSTPIENTNINDIAIYDSNKYYVYNGSIDPIIRINETSGQNEFILETDIPNLYTLSIRDDNFVVVSNNHFRRFDLNTGEYLSDIKIEIDGWITAIAPYNR
ncbi:hypothetical protein [Olleya sp. R77988]|uniref:hypothetical protein n=1 Tax=Olleya sp. R77988 TaxID=3093875 RepID=UPI0037C7FFA8